MAICQIFSKMLSVQPQGLVCYVMEKLGMEPIALLANSHTALITITLIDGYKYCGLYMIIFYSAFVSISKDVIEASQWMAQCFSTVSLHKASAGEEYIQHCHCNA